MKDEINNTNKFFTSIIIQILKLTNTNLNVTLLRSTMKSGTGANAVVPFFALLTLHHLKFPCLAVYKHTQNLGSVNAN